MRTSSKSTPCATSHRTASRRSRARLLRVMASNGLLYSALDRVLTSQITSTWRSAATMSISPSLHRQLRWRIRNPGPFRAGAWSSKAATCIDAVLGYLGRSGSHRKVTVYFAAARRRALLAALAARHTPQRQPRSEYR
jgi:hypothetical protein